MFFVFKSEYQNTKVWGDSSRVIIRYMHSESFREQMPFRRLEDSTFRETVKRSFADLLEARAAEAEQEGRSGERLRSFARDIRENKKIQRSPAPLGFFRGIFFDGPLHDYNVSNFEIDNLENEFFKDKGAQ